MKAIVQSRYGSPDLLEVGEIDKPTVGDDDVLLRVRAAAVNPLDWHNVRGLPYPLRMGNGLAKPKSRVLGVDVAGEVEAVGSKVTRLRPGDEVFGVCKGAFAEHALAREDRLAPKPAGLPFELAAVVLLEAGKVAPVIDRSYGLSEVPEALRYLEEGHARGKVVITL